MPHPPCSAVHYVAKSFAQLCRQTHSLVGKRNTGSMFEFEALLGGSLQGLALYRCALQTKKQICLHNVKNIQL